MIIKKTKYTSCMIFIVIASFALIANCSSDSGERITSSTPVSPSSIALFSLGMQDGDFGFTACQTALDGPATNIKNRGYTKAVFFGSTNSYSFINIATDADALATTEGTAITGNIAVFNDNTGTDAPTTMFGTGSGAAAVSLANLLAIRLTAASVTAGGGSFQNGGENVLARLGIGTEGAEQDFWSFIEARRGTYSTTNCTNATSNAMSAEGIYGDSINALRGAVTCDVPTHLLCIAR